MKKSKNPLFRQKQWILLIIKVLDKQNMRFRSVQLNLCCENNRNGRQLLHRETFLNVSVFKENIYDFS